MTPSDITPILGSVSEKLSTKILGLGYAPDRNTSPLSTAQNLALQNEQNKKSVNRLPASINAPVGTNPLTAAKSSRTSGTEADLDFMALMQEIWQQSEPGKTRRALGFDTAPSAQTIEPKIQEASIEVSKTQIEPPSTVSQNTEATAQVIEGSELKDWLLLEADLNDADRLFLQTLTQASLQAMPLSQLPMGINHLFGPASTEDGVTPYTTLSPELTEKLQMAYRKNLPLRVVLNDKTAVILKFLNGTVSAEFLTADPTQGMAVKQYLDELRTRLDRQHLPVGTLSYRNTQSFDQPNSQDSPSSSNHSDDSLN